MKKLTSNQIRKLWLDFFASKGHNIIPSASLIPNNDPSLLWINAGVAPLKKYFDGREIPSNNRMCNVQKCIRTNDIDNVGKTARHHTFFEMLGNFSIGNYFRDEVLTWAYELLFSDQWYGFDKENIYITYYPEDNDTYQKWLSLGVSSDHLIPIKDNFWEIGEGPCGPDTEIFYDRGIKYDPKNLGIKLLTDDIENDRYIEIWNIVFSQFNSVPGLKRSEYPELPSKNIDTGSGLERLTCIFQGTETNYETDLFWPLITYLEKITNHKYSSATDKMAFRVIVDHIRSVTFAISDGAILSNEGRGYVLRRILRRAVRYGRNLGIDGAFLYKMVSIVVDTMKEFYPYLQEKQAIVEKIVKLEEENFLKTLANGEKKLNEIIKHCTNNTISGTDAFLLYDTFGFPLELTEEIAEQYGYQIDVDAFNKELKEQKQRARLAMRDAQSMSTQNAEYINFTVESSFVGYEKLNNLTKVIGIFKDGKRVDSSNGFAQVVLEQTPFYAEMGGQIGDQGQLIYNDKAFKVYDTQKLPNGQHIHFVDLQEEVLKMGDVVEARVDEDFRIAVSKNHSATHLLNESLRSILGKHVVQQGSQVTNEGLRFDFNHYENITSQNILAIEEKVRSVIKAGYQVQTIETTLAKAKELGAQALFGEKYGNTVRLVDMTFSKELCGGTHVKNVAEISNFAITSIESKGSGIYRIEAISGSEVISKMSAILTKVKSEIIEILNKINNLVTKANEDGYSLNEVKLDLPIIKGSYQDVLDYRNCFERAKKLQKDVEKNYDSLKRATESSNYRLFEDKMYQINEIKVLVEKVNGMEVNVLKDIVDKVANDFEKCVIFFADVVDENKVVFIAKAKNNNINCGMLVKEAALICGGNGGGRADFAQAGGKDISKVDEAIKAIKGKL